MEKAYQALVKTLGRGEKGSRSLTFPEAYFLIRGFHEGIGSEVQLAAALMLMRVRGETIEEVAGAALGIKSTIAKGWSELGVSIDWPCYAGKRELLPWLLLAAKVLAGQGERVLLHGDCKSLSHRKHIANFIDTLNIPKVSNPKEAKEALDAVGICYVNADSLTPLVAQFRQLHQQLGLRSLFQTAIRCINPANAPVSLRSYFHPGLDAVHIEVSKLMANAVIEPVNIDSLAMSITPVNTVEKTNCTDEGNKLQKCHLPMERLGIFKGLQGETEINPRIATQFTVTTIDTCTPFIIPTRLEGFVGMSTLSSELEASLQNGNKLLSKIWHKKEDSLTAGTVFAIGFEDKVHNLAKATVVSTLSAIYLLLGVTHSVEEAECIAMTAWRTR